MKKYSHESKDQNSLISSLKKSKALKDLNIKKTVMAAALGTIVLGVGAISVLATVNNGNIDNALLTTQSVKSENNSLNKEDIIAPVKEEKASEQQYDLKVFRFQKTEIIFNEMTSYKLELCNNKNAEASELIWKSSDEKIAKVDDEGNITPVSNGKALISCTDQKSNAAAACRVTVDATVPAEKIQLDKSEYIFTAVKEKLKLKAEITPKNSTEKALSWVSSDEAVATVDKDGVVTSVKNGNAVITCKTENGLEASCKITVKQKVNVKSVTIDYESVDFKGSDPPPQQLKASVYPENATNKNVTWKSTDESVAQVNSNGIVTAINDGTCKIVCTSADGTYVSGSCEISVKDKNTVTYIEYTSNSVYVPVNPQVANTIIEEASRYVGVIPYVWGGTDLSSGVDCSGFICAVYERFGVNLWGLRTDLYLAGEEVPDISQAQAGDILVYQGHVALYDGNGGRIHAPDEGYMVTHDYNIGGYYTIRRIITN